MAEKLYSSEHPEELPVTQRVQRRQARRQAALERHRAMGRQGRAFEPPFNVENDADLEERRQAHAEGVAELEEQRRRTQELHDDDSEPSGPARGRFSAPRIPRGAKGYVDDGAGFLLGLFVYALVLNYLKGGTPRMKGWLAAKFLNRPYSGPETAQAKQASSDPGAEFQKLYGTLPATDTSTVFGIAQPPSYSVPLMPSAPALPTALQTSTPTPTHIQRVIAPTGAYTPRLPAPVQPTRAQSQALYDAWLAQHPGQALTPTATKAAS